MPVRLKPIIPWILTAGACLGPIPAHATGYSLRIDDDPFNLPVTVTIMNGPGEAKTMDLPKGEELLIAKATTYRFSFKTPPTTSRAFNRVTMVLRDEYHTVSRFFYQQILGKPHRNPLDIRSGVDAFVAFRTHLGKCDSDVVWDPS